MSNVSDFPKSHKSMISKFIAIATEIALQIRHEIESFVFIGIKSFVTIEICVKMDKSNP